MLGNIDSARTDNTGKFKFLDVGQNITYSYGAGKENHLAWEGDTIVTPVWSTPGDTVDITKNLDLIPSDSIHSRKSGKNVVVNGALIVDLFLRYNVQIGRNDTLRFNLSNSYSQIQKDSATAWITNYGAWTGVPTKMENNTFSTPPANFPIDTGDVSVLGVNITPGPSICSPFLLQYNGTYISAGANITNNFHFQRALQKEIGRITFDEAANCFMSPIANNMNSTGAAHADLIYVLNRAYFNDKHDLPRMTYLTNISTIIPK